ncbi:quinone oxidoreductase family protein [Salinicoccus sp. HZC-1]|uniref:quinone oxidoreductase family protein n=1 Tax=Salinicoccus sp. HZC-1 TaxID=3385497 RepID=UPI00398AAA47
MKSIVLNDFGKKNFEIRDIPVPEIKEDEVLIKVDYAGIGQWDIFERDGGYHELMDIEPHFPYILGSEGSGKIVKMGEEVKKLKIGDSVYACSFLNSSGGFYAEYAAVHQDQVRVLPQNLSMTEGAAIMGVGLTALRGLDTLELGSMDNIIIHGASGGVGHIAVQLSQIIGGFVFAVASGEDGADFCKRLGADSINGKDNDEIPESFRYNKLLMTAPMNDFENNVGNMRRPTTVAYPVGDYEVPELDGGEIEIKPYYGEVDENIIDRLDGYVRKHGLKCHVDSVFNMQDFEAAHTALENHYLGKLVFKIS